MSLSHQLTGAKGQGNKNSNTKRLGNYRGTDEDFFPSSALIRNGDYAMGKESWKNVDLNFKQKSPSPIIAISSSSMSSEKDMNYGEEEKFVSSGSQWSKGDSGFVKRLLSSKRK